MNGIAALQRRLGIALAVYCAGIILVVTLVPFHFVIPTRWLSYGYVSMQDLVANIGLFVPLGFFLAFGGERSPLVVGFFFSTVIELAQELVPGRYPSPLDVATNAIGAGLGGLAYTVVRGSLLRRSSPMGILALDLPLAGMIYLLVPLLWLTGLAAGHDGGHRWLAGLIAVAGAIAFAAIDRHLLKPRGTSRWAMPLAAGSWLGLGLLPGWFGNGWVILASAAAGAGLTAVLARVLGSVEPEGRRYELPAVRRAGLALGVFIVMAALWPVFDVGLAWRGGFGLGWAGDAQEGPILRFLELLAAVTVAGYCIAEARGRAVESEAASRRAVGIAAGAIGIAIAALRGFHPTYGASVAEAVVLAAAVGFGAHVYWRQRAFVRALLGRPTVDWSAPSQSGYSPPAPAPKWR